MLDNLKINRFHWFLFVLWQLALVFCCQQIFSVFYNYTPQRKCRDFDIYANASCSLSHKDECDLLKDCKDITLKETPPFHSLVEHFDLYCDHRAYYATVIATCQFVGVLVGTIIYGHLGDHFGRRPVSLIGISVGILSAVGSGLSPSWPLFAALRFIVGSSIACVLVVFYTFISELILPEQRVFLRSFFNWGYARVIFTLICYLCDHWRSAAIVSAAVVSPLVGCIFFILPESPVWLSSKGRIEEANRVSDLISKYSGVRNVQQDPNPVHSFKSDKKVFTIRDLLISGGLAKKTIILCTLWFSTSLSAFGSDLNSRNLAGNFYANQFVSGIVTAFAKIFVFVSDEYIPSFNRRRLHQIPQALVIICYLAIMLLLIFVKENDCDDNYWRNWAVIIINILGVAFIEVTWDACYLVAVECFPTKMRAIGMGTCSLFARAGALLAPQMAYLSNVSKAAPYGVVSGIGVLSLIISILYLPDTKGVDLSEVGTRDEEISDDKQVKNHIEMK